jgi:hypothetical protein
MSRRNDHAEAVEIRTTMFVCSWRLREILGRYFLRELWGGGILLAVIAAVTWYMETHECMTIGIKGEPPVWYVATLVALTVTIVYLLVMIYVAYIFTTMKKRLSIR